MDPDLRTLGHMPTFDSSSDNPASWNVPQHLKLTLAGGSEDDSAMVSFSALPGLPAVPQKVVKKILGGEYVEMADLRSDAWRMEELLYSSSDQSSTKQIMRKRPVTDILS